MIPDFIFLFSALFCSKERKGVVGFQLKERKWLLRKILATKIVDFCVKRFHMMRGVMFKCFFFTLKTPKTTDLSLRRIFISDGFRVLGRFIGFLVAIDCFNKVSKVFSRCFWSKIGWKCDFRWKKTKEHVFPAIDSGLRR